MPFTRNINYVQNEETSLGFVASHFNPSPSRDVSCTFQLDSLNAGGINLGQIIVPETSGVLVRTGRYGVNSAASGSILLSGDVAAVNAALFGTTFRSTYYEVDDLDQNFLALDRNLSDYKGELLVQIPSTASVAGVAIGDQVKFGTTVSNVTSYRFTVTKIDTSSSGNRIWMIYNRDYNLSDKLFASAYKTFNINKVISSPCLLQNISGVTIGPVIDLSFANPQGTLSFTFFEFDGPTVTNIFNMFGAPFLAEPVFSVLPPASVSTGGSNAWYQFPSMGSITQADNNFQSIQLLFKCYENDPNYLDVTAYTSLPGYPTSGTEAQKLLFIGNAIDAKASLSIPKYITNNSYGIIGDVKADNRASVSYIESGEVRWSYYDVPANCTSALSRIFYYRPASFVKDFNTEVRIINNKARIYDNRGK